MKAKRKRRPSASASEMLRQLTIDDLRDFEMRMTYGLDVPELGPELDRDVHRMKLETSSGVYAQRRSRW